MMMKALRLYGTRGHVTGSDTHRCQARALIWSGEIIVARQKNIVVSGRCTFVWRFRQVLPFRRNSEHDLAIPFHSALIGSLPFALRKACRRALHRHALPRRVRSGIQWALCLYDRAPVAVAGYFNVQHHPGASSGLDAQGLT